MKDRIAGKILLIGIQSVHPVLKTHGVIVVAEYQGHRGHQQFGVHGVNFRLGTDDAGVRRIDDRLGRAA